MFDGKGIYHELLNGMINDGYTGIYDSSGPEVDVAKVLLFLVWMINKVGKRMAGAKGLAATLGNIYPGFTNALAENHIIRTTVGKALEETAALDDSDINNECIVKLFDYIADNSSVVPPVNPLKNNRKDFDTNIVKTGS